MASGGCKLSSLASCLRTFRFFPFRHLFFRSIWQRALLRLLFLLFAHVVGLIEELPEQRDHGTVIAELKVSQILRNLKEKGEKKKGTCEKAAKSTLHGEEIRAQNRGEAKKKKAMGSGGEEQK